METSNRINPQAAELLNTLTSDELHASLELQSLSLLIKRITTIEAELMGLVRATEGKPVLHEEAAYLCGRARRLFTLIKPSELGEQQ